MVDIRVNLIGGDGGVPRMLLEVADREEFAAKAAKVLTDALEKQRREEALTAGESRALASALRATGDAEAKVAAKAIAADAAIGRLGEEMKKAGNNGGGLISTLKRVASEHDQLLKKLGGIGAGTGLFGAGAAGLSLGGPLAGLGAAAGAFGAVAAPELAKVEKALAATGKARKTAFAALSPAEKALAGNVQDLKDKFHGLESSMAPVISQVVKVGSAFLTDLMPAFKSLATVGGAALKTILGYLGQFLRSPAFAVITKQLANLANQVAPLLGKQLVALLKVFLQLFIQVGPAGLKLLRALLPAIVQLVTALTPAIVAVADLVAAFVQFLAQKHLLIPFLGAVALAFLAISAGGGPIFATVAAIAVLVGAIIYLVKHWSTVWASIKSITITAWHFIYNNAIKPLIGAFGDVERFVRAWADRVELTFLQWAKAIVHAAADAFGWVPGLGGKLHEADKALGSFIDSTKSRLYDLTHRNYALDFSLNLPSGVSYPSRHIKGRGATGISGAQAGVWLVGEEGPELAYLPQGTNVLPAGPTSHVMGGLASGTGVLTVHLSLPSLQAMSRVFGGVVSAIVQSVRSNARFSGGFPGSAGGLGRAGLRYLEDLWMSAGGPGGGIAHVAAAIALAESGGNPRAFNPSGASGIWQILGQVVPGDIFNPFINALNAVRKFDDAGGFSPWVTYTTGAYRQFLDQGGYLRPGWNLAYNGTGRPERVLSPRENRSGAQAIVLQVQGGGGEFEQALATILRKYVRVRGGDVQTVFGRN